MLPLLTGQTKAHVLRELVDGLAAQYPEVDGDHLFDVLSARERLGSTAIAEGVAIPHGRIPGLTNLIGAFGRHPDGVAFESLDGASTKLFFLVVAPDAAVGQHLKALARISRLVTDPGLRGSLLAATDRQEIYHRLVERDGQ